MKRLEFLGGGASHGLVVKVAAAEGIEVGGTFGPVGAMRDRFLAGDACDIVILTHAQLCELTALGRVDMDMVADLGTVRTSIAVRSGDAAPDVSTPEALRSALLAAEEIHFPDPQKATAGIHFAKVIDALGIREQVEPRFRTYNGGLLAMKAVAASSARAIGCTQTTEIVSTPGVQLVAPLPHPHGLATVYTAAVSSKARAGHARAFLHRLTGRESAGLRAEAGIEGVAIRRVAATSGWEVSAVRKLVFGILKDEYDIEPDPKETDRDLGDLVTHYFQAGGTFDVAIDPSGDVVACCGCHVTDLHTVELRKMYVRRDQRGQGLGGRLLERAMAFARGNGFKRIELETASVLKEAMAMYEKAGFVRQETAPHVKRCDRVYALDVA